VISAWLAFFEGIAAIALFAAGTVAAHFGLTFPIIGFAMAMIGGLLFGSLGVIFGVIGVFRTRAPQRAAGRPRAAVGLLLAAAVFFPILAMGLSGGKNSINDITTDIDNPPQFTHAQQIPANASRDLTYDRSKYADAQKAIYGRLEPLAVNADPAATFEKVKETAAQMPTWTVTSTDPATGTLEGYDTSYLYRFKDDFVIQVRPGAEPGKSLVEMRSKSRDGKGDFGVNYHRIVGFFDRLKADGASS